MRRIKRRNRPSTAAESQKLEYELREILEVDTDLQFFFDITFIGSSVLGLNNFECKVYPVCECCRSILLGTLNVGDVLKMRSIKSNWPGCVTQSVNIDPESGNLLFDDPKDQFEIVDGFLIYKGNSQYKYFLDEDGFLKVYK